MLISFDDLMKKYKMNIKGILHVGAHECEEDVYYSKHNIQNVIWLEALQEKVNTHSGNKKIYQIVVDETDNKDVVFNITNNYQSSSVLELDEHLKEHPSIHVIEKRNLRTKRIDTLFKEQNINNDINFLNLDIQGSELSAIKSMGDLLNKIDYIYTEVNTKHLYKDCCLIYHIDVYLNQFTRVETKMTPHGWGDALYIRKTLL